MALIPNYPEISGVQFGEAIKKLHSTDIPASITKDVSRETFSSKWRETVKAFLMRIDNEVFEEPVAVKIVFERRALYCSFQKQHTIALK